jgi:hypothetical protein
MYAMAGGKVFALDALFNITEHVPTTETVDGSNDVFKEQIEAHPSTPLDGSSDIAFHV